MNRKQKTLTIAQKVEGLSLGFIGICICSMGVSNLQERFIYSMPRILVPVYELLGPTALAIAMLLMGLGVIAWGFTKWKSAEGKKALYLVLAGVGLAIGFFLSSNTFKSPEEIKQRRENDREKQIEEIRQTTRPNFKIPAIDKYFDDFDALYTRLENANSAEEAEALYDDYAAWVKQTAGLIKLLDNNQTYEFSKYAAKMAIQWSEKIQEFWNDSDVE